MTDNVENEQQNVIVTLTKDEAKLVNWMRKSLSTDEARPVLNAMYVNGDLACCDGYRIILAPTPTSLQHLAGKLVNTHGNFKPGVPTAVTLGDDKYPNIKAVIPADTVKPIASFAVDAKYMVDALSGFEHGTPVRIDLYHMMVKVSGSYDNPNYPDKGDENIQVVTYLMPMHAIGDKHNAIETYEVYPHTMPEKFAITVDKEYKTPCTPKHAIETVGWDAIRDAMDVDIRRHVQDMQDWHGDYEWFLCTYLRFANLAVFVDQDKTV